MVELISWRELSIKIPFDIFEVSIIFDIDVPMASFNLGVHFLAY
jgi:hypothetical protein